MALTPTQMLRAAPVQFIETPDGALLKRGGTEVKVRGEGAAEALHLIFDALCMEGKTPDDICGLFPPLSRPVVENLLEQLLARRLLVPEDSLAFDVQAPESNLDIFYWNFQERTTRVTEQLNQVHFVILGVNYISRQLASTLRASGIENIMVVDHPFLRNLSLFDEMGTLKKDQWLPFLSPLELSKDFDPKAQCIIGTSDFGGSPVLREWNTFCITRKRHFMPVVLRNLIGYIGPFVVPGETACFECLQARENSHREEPEARRAIEDRAFEAQKVIGFHPSMASVLADIAAFELTKFYSGAISSWNIGSLIEVNLLDTRMTARKVLKVPRCAVCSPMSTRASTTAYQTPVFHFQRRTHEGS